MKPQVPLFVASLLLGISLPGFAADKPAANPDPWQGLNRRIFAFNEFMDRNFLKPVAQGYQAVTPGFVDRGVSNVFSNIEEVPNFANHLLQFRLEPALKGLSRFTVNSTLGVAGLFDVASRMGIERNDTDLGETFGRWGVGPGPYLVLPFLGPSTVRDGIGRGGDFFMDPISYIEDDAARYGTRALDAVDTRADLLDVEKLVTGDRYIFIRDTWLQHRAYEITGQLPPEEEEDFLDEEESP